jgi:hypothetical protein
MDVDFSEEGDVLVEFFVGFDQLRFLFFYSFFGELRFLYVLVCFLLLLFVGGLFVFEDLFYVVDLYFEGFGFIVDEFMLVFE